MLNENADNRMSINGESKSPLSYKFQRLREQLRAAVASGELSGKLPGERVLAKRFDVNPKTLSKALTDLAAEGLLDRSIGRGPYVMGSREDSMRQEGRWLILSDPSTDPTLVNEIMRVNPDAQMSVGMSTFRPSFINAFSAVIDLCPKTSSALHRSLLVRGIPVVLVGQAPRVSKTHAVLFDRDYAAFLIARRLLLSGQRKLLAVEPAGQTVIFNALRNAADRYEADAEVISCEPGDVPNHVFEESLGIVCDGDADAARISGLVDERRSRGAQWDLSAVGFSAQPRCSGYFAHPSAVAEAIADVLRDVQAHRPSVLWLVGTQVQITRCQASQIASAGAGVAMAVLA